MTQASTWVLRRRLLRNVLLAVAGGWVATVGVGIFALYHEMAETLDSTMETDAGLVLRLLENNDSATVAQWIDTQPDNEDQLLRIYQADMPVPPAPWPLLAEDGLHRAEGWLVLRRSSGSGVVEIGQSLGWRLEEIIEAAQAFLLLIVPLLLLVTWAIVMTLRAGLSPVFGFTEGVRRRSPEDLSALPIAGLPQELRIMAEALNGYLKRIGDLRQAERAFIANAAHELRTPLAVIRSRLQLLAEDAAEAPTVPEIMSSVDTLSRRVERLLQLERAESGIGLARQRVDLVALVRLVCREMGVRARTIVFDDGDQERYLIDSDPDALAIILRNLLDNALEHGADGVSIRLVQDGRLVIRNPVSACPDFRTERFSKAQGSGGAGLGLDIVQRLCADLRIPVQFSATDTIAQVELRLGQALDFEENTGTMPAAART